MNAHVTAATNLLTLSSYTLQVRFWDHHQLSAARFQAQSDDSEPSDKSDSDSDVSLEDEEDVPAPPPRR